MQVWMEVERASLDGQLETLSVSGTDEECEEFIQRQARLKGTVHVLDEQGRRARTVQGIA